MTDPADVTRAKDPTKAVLSESALHEKHLCDYVINVATGCAHSCRFCYVPATPNIRTRGEMLKKHADVDDGQAEWGQYVLYRDDIPERLPGILERKRTWNRTEKGCGIVGVSFGTDCFMDKRAAEITASVIETLADHERYCRILTRNPMLAAHYMDTFREAAPYVTIGSSIPTFNEDEVAAIEPGAPPIAARLEGLQRFAEAGVPVYVSMSPTYPTLTEPEQIGAMLERFAKLDPSVVFHEPINPRGSNFEMTVNAAAEAGETDLAESLDALRYRKTWYRYACIHFDFAQKMARKHNVPIHLWPDKQMLKMAGVNEAWWLERWRDRQSPEPFAGRDTPDEPPPEEPPYFSFEEGNHDD